MPLRSRPLASAPALAALVSAAFVFAVPLSAQAAPVTLEFNQLSELAAGGWTNYPAGTTEAQDGRLLITGASFEEWALEYGNGAWWQGSLDQGWLVEARVRIIAGQADCASTGFWVADNAYHVTKVQLSTTWAGISYASLHGIEMNTTDDFHNYRLQYLGRNRYQFLVDGKLIQDVHQLESGRGSMVLMFGDLGGCKGASSAWESFTYDTAPYPIVEGDADGDNVQNDVDRCATDADAKNIDTDGDGDGDVCDACPNDPENDVDHDGVCGDEDTCPTDFRNDKDSNGVCDTEQCRAVEAQVALCRPEASCGAAATCPAVCNCQPPFVGVDPMLPLDTGLLTPAPGTPGAVPLGAASSATRPTPSTVGPAPSSNGNASNADVAGAPLAAASGNGLPPTASTAAAVASTSPAASTASALASAATASATNTSSRADSTGGGCAVSPGSMRNVFGTWGLPALGLLALGLFTARGKRQSG